MQTIDLKIESISVITGTAYYDDNTNVSGIEYHPEGVPTVEQVEASVKKLINDTYEPEILKDISLVNERDAIIKMQTDYLQSYPKDAYYIDANTHVLFKFDIDLESIKNKNVNAIMNVNFSASGAWIDGNLLKLSEPNKVGVIFHTASIPIVLSKNAVVGQLFYED